MVFEVDENLWRTKSALNTNDHDHAKQGAIMTPDAMIRSTAVSMPALELGQSRIQNIEHWPRFSNPKIVLRACAAAGQPCEGREHGMSALGH